jgi:membrane associated rhomboid family serine protease
MIPYADNIPARRFPVMIPAWIFLGGRRVEGNWALLSNTGGSGVAFFAHVGGFVFGFVVTRLLIGAGRLAVEGTRWAAPA